MITSVPVRFRCYSGRLRFAMVTRTLRTLGIPPHWFRDRARARVPVRVRR